jgi:uncharacterized protein (TIGR00251 family)
MTAQSSPWRLQIHLQPRASQNRILCRQGDAIKVQVHAPPVEGAANAALIGVLAAALGVPRRSIHILRGVTSRTKLVEIHTSDLTACQRRLEEVLRARVDKAEAGD